MEITGITVQAYVIGSCHKPVTFPSLVVGHAGCVWRKGCLVQEKRN